MATEWVGVERPEECATHWALRIGLPRCSVLCSLGMAIIAVRIWAVAWRSVHIGFVRWILCFFLCCASGKNGGNFRGFGLGDIDVCGATMFKHFL